MNLVVWILLGLLSLKVIWNFGVPYALMRKPIDPKTGRIGGISLALWIEFMLLLLAVVQSWLSKGDSMINRPLIVLSIGGAAILASYIHFFIGGLIAGWVLSQKQRPQTPGSPPSTPRD